LNRALRQESHSLLDQKFGAATRNEDAVVEFNPQATEFCPAQYMLQRIAGNAPFHEGGDASRTRRRSHEQPRLVLGKNTTGQPKPIHDCCKDRDRRNGFTAHSGA
jgi:hypothetical protein